MTDLFAPMTFARGPAMKNRFAVAPLTNLQSNADGTISDAEFKWLEMRAQGGFGMTMTCAAFVAQEGRGFGSGMYAGQLGAGLDEHIPGLTRIASRIKEQGSVAVVQIHHAGYRSEKAQTGMDVVSSSDDPQTGARAMTVDEIEVVIEKFIAAAVRCEKAGFDGVELHGAHGYLLAQFMSPEINKRTDGYGGSLENRFKITQAIIDGIRQRCGANFNLGIRISPERYGQVLPEMLEIAQHLFSEAKIDYLDMSLWDYAKKSEDKAYTGTLASHFAKLNRGQVRLGGAGKIALPSDAQALLDEGYDFAFLGKGSILNHDFPNQLAKDAGWTPRPQPASRAALKAEGLSDGFVDYMKRWEGFVDEAKADA